MKIKLLVDSDEFKAQLEEDLRGTKEKAYFLMLTFEMDSAGRFLIENLKNTRAKDKRILIDKYTRFVLSDRFLYTPKNFFNKELSAEKRLTLSTIKAQAHGIKFRWTNNVGFFMRKFAKRNHKKMIILDDNISYIGGINFSDHNFNWHDLMLRIESREINQFLTEDFIMNWEGKSEKNVYRSSLIDIFLLSGRENEETFKTLFKELMPLAEERIIIHTPYLTFPFFELIESNTGEHVQKIVITAEDNNKGIVKNALLFNAIKHGFSVKLFKGGMSHLKAILIDDKFLITGSSNFDYLSYTVEEEIVAIVKEKSLIDEFKKRVILKDLKNSDELNPKNINFSRVKNFLFENGLKFLAMVSKI